MAIPWLVVLQSVPWSQVIDNAPKLAEGAKKLLRTVSNWSPVDLSPADKAELPADSEAETIAALQVRLAAMEHAVKGLHEQMLASSELIKTLADQNAELIKHIEGNHLRFRWLGAVVAVTALVALLSLILLLVR